MLEVEEGQCEFRGEMRYNEVRSPSIPFGFEWTAYIFAFMHTAEGHRSCKSGKEFDTILLSSSCAKFRAKLTREREMSFFSEQVQRRRWVFWKSLDRDWTRLGFWFSNKKFYFSQDGTGTRKVRRLYSNRKDIVWILKIIVKIIFIFIKLIRLEAKNIFKTV